MTDSAFDRCLATSLACPACHHELRRSDETIRCAACDFTGQFVEGVFTTLPRGDVHFFDDRHEIMQEGNEAATVWSLCYERQIEVVSNIVQAGDVVLDVGCGPSISYRKRPDFTLIGIDPSFKSIRVNDALDVRVFGSAAALPLRDRSVDRILCFYSVHHMVGATIDETRANVAASLREFARVTRPGGDIVVFDMSPWWPADLGQKLVWNRVRARAPDVVDMFFWRAGDLERLGRAAVPHARFTRERFPSSPFMVFPPMFSYPNLKVPRFLYPFDVNQYRWHLPESEH